MKNRRTEFSLNIGTSSLLFIFVILCLVSFSILSLSSAISDQKLSKRVVENTNAYYNACEKAEELICSFDDTLKALYETDISRSGYFDKVGKVKAFAVPIDDLKTLEVEIKILYPDGPGKPFYKITSWKTDITGELEYDDSLAVFK